MKPVAFKDAVGGSIVSILFLKGRSDDPPVNKITSMLGSLVHGNEGFCHVEITIPDRNGMYTSSSIYQGEKVTLTQSKTFLNPGYVIHSIVVSPEELERLAAFVREKHNAGVSFDKMGMVFAALPFEVRRRPHDMTFCSRYVTEALQDAGLQCVQGLNPSITTPSKLYNVLLRGTRDRGVAGSVQHKQNLLKQGGKVPLIAGVTGKASQGYQRLGH